MKKLLLPLLPVVAILTACNSTPTTATAPAAPSVQAAAPVDPTVGAPKRGNARFYELHASFLRRTKTGPIGVLFLGDSITEGWTKAPAIWEKYYAGYQPANFGIGGDQTQHVIWRIEDGELAGISPKVVVLMIGTNNSGANTAAQILAADTKIVELIRSRLPETKVLLLAIFPRGPRGKNPTGAVVDDSASRMRIINEVNAGLAKLDDGKMVRFLDIGHVFLGADGKIPDSIMPDQLHPNVAGYQLWVDAMQPRLDEMMR